MLLRKRMNKKIGEFRAQVRFRPGGKLSRVVARAKFEKEPFQRISDGSTWRIQKSVLQRENLSESGDYTFTLIAASQILCIWNCEKERICTVEGIILCSDILTKT